MAGDPVLTDVPAEVVELVTGVRHPYAIDQRAVGRRPGVEVDHAERIGLGPLGVKNRDEQLNKQFGSRLLVSEVVWRAAGEAAKDAVPLGPVPVKGHSAPVQVYRLA